MCIFSSAYIYFNEPLTSSQFSSLPRSQSDQNQLHYSTAEAPYSTKPMSMTLPLHPSLMEHYLPRSLEPPQAPRGPEEPDEPRSKPPYSEGEESDGGERSEGELVVLTDWHERTGCCEVKCSAFWRRPAHGVNLLLFLDYFMPAARTMLRDGLMGGKKS